MAKKIWEYVTVRLARGDDTASLNRLGEQGWEAYTAVEDDGGTVIHLKRLVRK